MGDKKTLELAMEAGFAMENSAAHLAAKRFAELIREDYRAKLIGASVEPSIRAGEELGDFSMTEDHYTAEALAARVVQMQDELNRLDVLLEECKMDWSGDVAQLKAEHAHELAARVAQAQADEREACVRVCVAVGKRKAVRSAFDCADAIRARKESQKCSD